MEGVNELNGPKIIPLVDPDTGEELKLTKDGTFQNLRTKAEFVVNDRGFIISLTDPITEGKAHVENDLLVSDDTGKKYPINKKGEIILEEKKEEKVSRPQPKEQPKVKQTIKQTVKQTTQVKIKPPVKQIPLEVIYNDYVNRYLNLVYQESGVVLEFIFDKNNKYCTSNAISSNKLIYKTNFQNLEKFQNNVLQVIIREFIKNSEEVTYKEKNNLDNYDLILKNKDTDEIRFINLKENLLYKIKPKEKLKIETEDEEQDEKLEIFKFYLVTVTTTLLIILCVLGIVLLFG